MNCSSPINPLLRTSGRMMKKLHPWGLPVLLIGLLPSLAFALAGIAERTSFFHYNDFTRIERGHPSDICSGSTKWCLALYRDGYRDFKGIDSTFTQLNIPSDTATPYIIGQRLSDDRWLVYDLQKEQILIEDVDYQKVIEVWCSLGLARPSYVDARNTRELLTETQDSIASRWRGDLQMWLFWGLLPLTPVALIFCYISWKTRQQCKKNRTTVLLVFSYVFLAPVLFIVYAVMSSFIAIIRQNW